MSNIKGKRQYTKEFKLEAVELLKSSGKPATAIARDLGIPNDALSRWKRELEDTDKKAFTGHGNVRDEELMRLRKECADLKMERDILKKAVAIFSKPENRNMYS